MRHDFWFVRHRLVAVLDPAAGGSVVLREGTRPGRRIRAMGHDVTSAGVGRIVVRSRH